LRLVIYKSDHKFYECLNLRVVLWQKRYPFCGDGIWDVGETLENCPEDYPIPRVFPKRKVISGVEAETCSDRIQNQNETDVDCGGVCPACEDENRCKVDEDCVSNYCYKNVCKTSVEVEKPLVRTALKPYIKPAIFTLLVLLMLSVIFIAVISYRKKKSNKNLNQ